MASRATSGPGGAFANRPPLWMVALAAAFFGYFSLLVYNELGRPEPAGFFLQSDASGLTVRSVIADSVSERAGLRVGDRVLTAAGLPMRTRVEWESVAANLRIGSRVRLLVERGDRYESIDLEFRQVQWSYWTTRAGATLLTARGVQFITLVLALVVAFSRPFDTAARIGAWTLATISVYSIAWPYQIALTWRGLPDLVGLAFWLPYASSLATPAVALTFFATFPRRLIRRRWQWLAIWAPMLPSLIIQLHLALLVVYQPALVSGTRAWRPLHASVLIGYAISAALCVSLGYRTIRDVTERRRLRVLVVGSVTGLLGVVPAAVAYLSSDIAPGSSMFAAPLMMVGIVLALALPMSMAYAILRYRLFDVSFLVRRGIQYALARGLLTSLVPLLGALFVVDVWMNRHDPLTEVLVRRGWIYALLTGLTVIAARRRGPWLAALDRRFFRQRYNAHVLLRRVSDDIRAAASLDEIAPRIVGRIAAALHPRLVALQVRASADASYRVVAATPDPIHLQPLPTGGRIARLLQVLQRPVAIPAHGDDSLVRQLPADEVEALRADGIELLVPVVVGDDRPEALVVLGPKLSEEPYSAEDEDLLRAIADSLALLLARAAAAAQPLETLDDCPTCGTCYDAGTARCPADGAAVTTVLLPRLLGGRYRLTQRVGRGGMGTVYAALDTALDRRVAAKVLREDLTAGRDAAVRFQREARLVAGLVHPNVVTVHDIGMTPSGRGYFIMELLEGSTVRDELRRSGALALPRVLQILRGVGAALTAAHERGIVHRDLKPENIWLCRSGSADVPKILDFGLAKPFETGHEGPTTSAGMVAGTPSYMSPEHRRGGDPSPDWDLWALAVIAFEMITGALPPAAVDGPACLGDLPAPLRPLFARALSPFPINRPTSPLEFVIDLDRSSYADELPS